MIQLKRIGWKNGTLVSKAKVQIDGQIYEVEPEEYEGETPTSAENFSEMENNTQESISELEELLKGTVLYENEQGTTGNVTLDYSAENYETIEIYYTVGTRSGSVKTRNFSNNEKISLNITGISASTFVNVVKEIQVSGNLITKVQERTFNVYAGGTQHSFNESDTIKITKVVGYKY